jgi:parvulin-like peptidyl-prolyl isomerase
MKPTIRTMTVIAALLTAGWFGTVAAADLALATVDGEAITLEQLKRDFELRHQGHMSILGDEAVVREFLDAAIQRLLFVQEGRRLGLAEHLEIRAKVLEKKAQIASSWLYETEVERRIDVSDGQIEDALKRMTHARDVTWIRTDTLDEAQEVVRRIDAGEAPDALARELSRDPNRMKGGEKRVVWGLEEPDVERAIFEAAIGTVAGPVACADGYVVAMVNAEEEREPTQTEEARAIAARLLRKRLTDSRRGEYLDELGRRYGLELHRELLAPETIGPVIDAGTADDPRPVATFEGGTVTLGEFATTVDGKKLLALRPALQRLRLEQLLSDRLDAKLVELEGLRRWDEVPDSRGARVSVFENELVYRTLLAEVVLADLSASEEEIRAFFEERRDDYVVPPQVRLAVALLDSEQDATAFLGEARGGVPFDELAREKSLDPGTAVHGGRAGWVTPERAIEPLRNEVFDRDPGTFGGPVKIEKGWLVYKVIERKERRPLELAEVRDRVRQEVLDRKNVAAMNLWAGRLQAAAKVRIRESALRKAGKLLAEEEAERLQRTPPSAGHGQP